MTVMTSVRGFDRDSEVKASETRRAPDISGRKIKIKANSFGIADSSVVDEMGNHSFISKSA
ncbi:MAG TPA: hypothetical protein VN665_02870 [Candidatus Paceibacterota bacterium]|nr:hypothetical protein [Candidatus Paceibacterota bacterium]